jgi:hypothetical protein
MDTRMDFIIPELFYRVFIRKKYLKPSKPALPKKDTKNRGNSINPGL